MRNIFNYSLNFEGKLLLRKVSEIAGDEKIALVIFKGNEDQDFIRSVEKQLGGSFLKLESNYGVFELS